MILRIGDLELRAYRPNTYDVVIARRVMAEDCYKLYGIHRKVPVQRIVDIGGHIGCFALLAKRRWPNASIDVYEPWRDNWHLLGINTEGLSEVPLHQCAVIIGDQTTCRLSFQNCGPSGINTGGACVCDHGTEVVSAVSIDAVLASPLDLLKLDCEGLEAELLEQAAKKNLLQNIAAIVGEYHDVPGGTSVRRRLATALEITHDVTFVCTSDPDGLGLFFARSLTATRGL